MAIYTQYGRYLKAKMFKEMLENGNGNTYMLLGLGEPDWDSDLDASNPSNSTIPQMPMGPYNTSILTGGSSTENQFYDNNINQYFSVPVTDNTNNTITISSIEKCTSLKNGKPEVYNPSRPATAVNIAGNYLELCKDLLPPFPCSWYAETSPAGADTPRTSGEVLINTAITGSITVTRSNYSECYITKYENNYRLHGPVISGQQESYEEDDIDVNYGRLTKKELQYIAELYLRGCALTKNIISPVGLLGAVKCNISFVKDIGSNYTGDTNQFWYGDRYWEIVYPDDSLVNNYIKADDDSQKIYPHHLLISSTINPRQLCPVLKIDQNIVPRQIALFTCDNSNYNERYYRVGENVFNFGQYSSNDEPDLPPSFDGKILNFTLPCNVKYNIGNNQTAEMEYPEGDFKFILNDYIKGGGRIDIHSAERIGYVIGF